MKKSFLEVSELTPQKPHDVYIEDEEEKVMERDYISLPSINNSH